MPDDTDPRGTKRLLARLERAFCAALLVLLALAVLGQAILSTAWGRDRFSRVDRLEGTMLRVIDGNGLVQRFAR
ncbi:MAG: hypothetical protein ACM3ZU_09880 [Bacteroidota bacterium]